jgi:hypothetical protein
MRRQQLWLGVAVLVAGVALMAGAHAELPRSPPGLSTSALGTGWNVTLPAETPVPARTVFEIDVPSTASSLQGNFSVLPSAPPPGPPISLYVLSLTDWAGFNHTLSAGGTYPPSFLLGVANRTAANWTLSDPGGGPMALLYLLSLGDGVAARESVLSVPTAGGSPAPVPGIPSSVSLEPTSPTPGRAVLTVPTLGTAALGFGASLELVRGDPGPASLYFLSPNATARCPASSFLPRTPGCVGGFSTGAPLSTQHPRSDSFVVVRGSYAGWDLIVLSNASLPGGFLLNETETDFSDAVVLGLGNVLIAIGAGVGFFGFLALSGALVAGERGFTAPLEEAPTPLSSGATAASAVASGTAPDAPSSGSPAVGVPEVARATCGLCGTGYPVRGPARGCPVCGSRSVVFSPPVGVELK